MKGRYSSRPVRGRELQKVNCLNFLVLQISYALAAPHSLNVITELRTFVEGGVVHITGDLEQDSFYNEVHLFIWLVLCGKLI